MPLMNIKQRLANLTWGCSANNWNNSFCVLDACCQKSVVDFDRHQAEYLNGMPGSYRGYNIPWPCSVESGCCVVSALAEETNSCTDLKMRILLIEIPPPVVKMKSAENGTPSPFQFDAISPLASCTNVLIWVWWLRSCNFCPHFEWIPNLPPRNFLPRNLPNSGQLDHVAVHEVIGQIFQDELASKIFSNPLNRTRWAKKISRST